MNTCRGCIFLAKTTGSGMGAGITKETELNCDDRDILTEKGNLGEKYLLKCHQMLWKELPEDGGAADYIDKNRNDCFFYFEWQEDVLFPGAEKLQEQKSKNAELKKQLKISAIGIWVVGIFSFLTLVWELIKYYVYGE